MRDYQWVAKVVGFALLGATLAACGSTELTASGAPQTPREPTCEFRMFTTPPEGYAEIAALDVKPGAYGTNVYTDVASFKDKIRPYVCKAGGDAAIGFANGYGMYIKATVLKRVPAAAVVNQPAAAAPQPADTGGCHYDTQCKGDRVCTKGECVPPAAPSPAAPPAPAATSN